MLMQKFYGTEETQISDWMDVICLTTHIHAVTGETRNMKSFVTCKTKKCDIRDQQQNTQNNKQNTCALSKGET